MSKATLPQAISLLTRVQDKDLSCADLEAHFNIGLFSDLLDIDPRKVDRAEFRRVIGHPDALRVIEPPELPPLLVFDDAHIALVDLSMPHGPQAFWQTTKEAPARYVWTNVFAQAKAIKTSGIVKIPYADLARGTTMREILAAPDVGNHDVSKLSKIIAKMIAKQPNGEAGDLLNDGRGNLFPCGSVLVHVYWIGDYRLWYVVDWDLAIGVVAGRRVFSGNLKL